MWSNVHERKWTPRRVKTRKSLVLDALSREGNQLSSLPSRSPLAAGWRAERGSLSVRPLGLADLSMSIKSIIACVLRY